jgi:hypothetical protein
MKDRFPADAEVQSSGLRTDELVEAGDRFAASDGDRDRIHLSPRDLQEIEVFAEDLSCRPSNNAPTRSNRR